MGQETSTLTGKTTNIKGEIEGKEDLVKPTVAESAISRDDESPVNWNSEINSTNYTPELSTDAMVESKDLDNRKQQNSLNTHLLIPSGTKEIPIVNIDKEKPKLTSVATELSEEYLSTRNKEKDSNTLLGQCTTHVISDNDVTHGSEAKNALSQNIVENIQGIHTPVEVSKIGSTSTNDQSEDIIQSETSPQISKEMPAVGENNDVICKGEGTETPILSSTIALNEINTKEEEKTISKLLRSKSEDFNKSVQNDEAEEFSTNDFSTADKSEEILNHKENKEEQQPSVNYAELDNESVINMFSAKAKLNEIFAPLGIKPEYITEEDAKLGFRTTIHIHFQGEKYHKRKQDAEHDVAYLALEKFEKIIQNVKIDIGETTAPAQGGKKFKSRIQECLQKQGGSFPTYNTQLGNNGFSSSVTINEQSYKSLKSYLNKRDAEEDAAQVAFKELGFDNTVEPPGKNILTEKEIEACKLSPKNVLQEYVQRCLKGGQNPVYETPERRSPYEKFKSTVTCGENKYTGEGSNKKTAEADAAREALKTLSGMDFEEISNPE